MLYNFTDGRCFAIPQQSGIRCANGAQKNAEVPLCGPHLNVYRKNPNRIQWWNPADWKQEETNVVRLKRDKTEPEPTVIDTKEIYDTWKEEEERVDHCTDPECDAFITSQHDLEVHLSRGDHTYPKGHRKHEALVMSAREALKKAEEKAKNPVLMMFTGHRSTPTNPTYQSTRELLRRGKEHYGPGNFGAVVGGGKGADYIAAKAAKDEEVPYHLYIPHRHYFTHYEGTASQPCSRENWTRMLNGAASVTYVSDAPEFHWSMNHDRNAKMISVAKLHTVISGNHPNILLGQRRGGTANAVKQMRDRGITHVWFIQSESGHISWVRLGQEVR